MNMLRTTTSVFLRAAVAALALSALAAQAFDMQSHRGGRGLRPENTLVSFENALRMGTTTLEMDIAITSDGIPVISHDPALNPAFTRNAKGEWLKKAEPLIKNMTLAEVQTYDVGRLNPNHKYGREWPEQQQRDGVRIPTLAAVFKLVNDLGANDVHFDMETKINPDNPNDTLAPEEFVNVMLKVIREHGMTKRVMVQSFDWRTLELLHKLEPDIRTMYLTMQTPGWDTANNPAWTAGHKLADFKNSVPDMVHASAGTSKGIIWAPLFKNLTPELVKRGQALGMQVIPWTVNQKPDMQRMIQWGVDGIISDYPDRLREVMAAQGIALPKGVGY